MSIDEAIRQILDSVLKNKAIYLLYEDRVALCKALNILRKYQKIEQILNTNVVYRDSDFMMLSAIKRVIDGNKQEDLFWKFIDEV